MGSRVLHQLPVVAEVDADVHYLSQCAIRSQSSDVSNPVADLWSDARDVEGLGEFVLQGRNFDHKGVSAIDPSSRSVINKPLTRTDMEFDCDIEFIQAAESTGLPGSGATIFEGEMAAEPMTIKARAWRNSRNSYKPPAIGKSS